MRLQALRLNHLIKTSVAPKLKEATTSDPSGPQIWVPLSQGEMKRKRRRAEGAGLSSAKGGCKGPGRGKGGDGRRADKRGDGRGRTGDRRCS